MTPARRIALGGAFAAVYLLSLVATVHWMLAVHDIPVVVPSAGVALGMLLVAERRHWPALLGIVTVLNLAVILGAGRWSVPTAITLVVLKAVEPAAAAAVLHRWAPGMVMERRGDVVALTATAIGVCVLADVVLSAVMVGAGDVAGSDAFTVWGLAVVGDTIGMITGASVFLGLRSGLAGHARREWVRVGAITTGFVVFTWVVIVQEPTILLLPYLPFAVALLIAAVEGPRAGSAAAFTLAISMGLASVHGQGLFGGVTAPDLERVTGAQLYMAVTTLIVLFAAAVQAQWRLGHLRLEDDVRTRTGELAESERRYRELVERSADIIYRLSLNPLRMDYISPSIERIMGVPAADIYADPALGARLAVSDPRGQAPLTQNNLQVWETGPVQVRYRRPGTEQDVWLEHRVTVLRDPDTGEPTAVEGVARDVTEVKAAEAALAHRATHDSLTGLPNRQVYFERLEEARAACVRHGTPFATMLFDIDGFKTINDRLGHIAGDQLLVTIAHRLRSILRPNDTLARFGGDEMAVLATYAEPDGGAEALAARILTTVHQPAELEGQTVRPSVSIGVAIARPGTDLSALDLVRRADAALYNAKAHGKNQFRVFDDSLRAWIDARLEAERELRDAVAQRQFVLHYQPEIDLDSGTVTGVEALLRWQHPSRGLLSPREFLPLAEETGLMAELGAWAFEEACTQLRAWQELTGRPVTVSVNLSAGQLRHRGLAADLTAAAARAGAEPANLRIEVTETALLAEPDDTAAALHHLHNAGMTIAVDDFGTGYSSLTHLRRLPIDTLKIDGSFVAAIETATADAAIVEAIVNLAGALDLHVVAEGVETSRQRDALHRLGCHNAQGYLFARPQPADELTATLVAAGTAAPARAGVGAGPRSARSRESVGSDQPTIIP